ncbi:Anhydro-N-acetylmuramic acid kinase [uncultured Defluviicoccus sp.]|uniref:Anhydro-N-acetylmuramic acid kinase n=1 Tax=metagenome TaxID=256318 RepID=A0A380TGB8_9ZZZZ|nr:Anhydro-N-acetylmuramic acid kinase [uncultured Defluviicoccus sp.]
MSGTSLDGVDAALLTTDGTRATAFGPALTLPYSPAFRAALRACLGQRPQPSWQATIEALTDRHADAVEALLARAGIAGTGPAGIDVIGFHGQTVWHDPEHRETIQIGDPQRLADRLRLPVVADFRTADVQAGGQGAPLVPLYHQALAADLEKPLAVVNLGGVANITWIGRENGPGQQILAFDTGPGNALIDDWVRATTGEAFDADGRLAQSGRADCARLDRWLAHPYFRQPPPKSLDRDAFAGLLAELHGLTAADGAATLAAFTAATIGRARAFLPQPPRRWLLAGGGRHNGVLAALIAEAVGAPVAPVEAVGGRGDALEAEAFAFLAVRSLKGLPLSLPGTTGVPTPQPGGRLWLPGSAAPPPA